MSVTEQLQRIIEKLPDEPKIKFDELEKIIKEADRVGKSWSGSWLGYQSRVYYVNFSIPPAGAMFSRTDGFDSIYSSGTRGDWRQYNFDDIISYIYQNSGDIDIGKYKEQFDEYEELFDETRSNILSLIYANKSKLPDDDLFLQKIIEKIEKFKIYTERDFVDVHRPRGKLLSTDMNAISEGIRTPPHIAMIAKMAALRESYSRCVDLKKESIKLFSHISNIEKKEVKVSRVGTNIFLGHGRSHLWRELKDFIKDKLHLPYDEFNRVPIAGTTNIARLAQMLDQASFAFLIMTAEDELQDGNMQARMNVIHEVGLFQGRLGFEKAIVLLEEGCQEFSNINGLGQIRFPKGNISAIFEQIREVLEREELI
ncbi:TPA: TIR domain-containing protein [Morganella morganii]